MAYKNPELQRLARRLSLLRKAQRLGKTYRPNTPEMREQRQRRKLVWALTQIIYRRMTALSGKTAKQRQWLRSPVRAKRIASRPPRVQLTDTQRREAKRIHRLNRQIMKRHAGTGLSRGIRKRLFFLQKGRCAACHVRLKATGLQKFHLDHIEPLALGGPHCDRNVQLLCPTCNVHKGAKPPMAYMQSLGRLL